MENKMNVQFNAKIKPIKPINEEFTLCKIYVMGLGKNRNLSHISKEACDDALETLYNVPVIGHLYVDDEGKYHMGGHDETLTIDSNGDLAFQSLCVPFGVVPQQDNVAYEDVVEPNGKTVTYLTCDCILWSGRFPEMLDAIYDENTYFGQSMEICVKDHSPLEEDNNYTDIKKYSYSALCLLGKSDNPDEHVEPCFPMSRVEPYEFSLDDKFAALKEEFAAKLSDCFSQTKEEEIEEEPETDEFTTEEEIITGETIEEEPAAEVTETEEVEQMAAEEPEEPASTEPVEEELKEFSSTYKKKRCKLSEILPQKTVYEEGECVYSLYYYMEDFDDQYVYVSRDLYTKDEGESITFGRMSYIYDESTEAATVNDDFTELIQQWLTPEENAALEALKNDYFELVEYKAHEEEAKKHGELDAALEEFSDLKGNEEYEAILNKRYEYTSVEELQNACYIVRGKYSRPQTNKSNKEGMTVVNIAHPENQTDREEFFAKYGIYKK